MSSRLLLIIPLLGSLTACGGGGASATAPSSAANVAPAATATIISAQTAATHSVRVIVENAAPTIVSLVGYTGCTTAADVRTCSIDVTVPTGPITLTLSTFASADGSGSALSIGTSTATIAPGVTNTITVGLHPILNSLALTLTPNMFTIGTPASSSVTLTALDAAGTIIPAGSTIVDPANAPLTMVLTDADPSGATSMSAPDASGSATLSYNGELNVADISISAAAHSSSGASFIATSAPLGWRKPAIAPLVASVASLTFISVGTAQSFTVSQAHYSGAFTATVSGGDPSAVSIALSGSTIGVTPLHAGGTSIVITGGNSQTLSVPVNVTTSTLTFQ
jgi:hypothetical protein